MCVCILSIAVCSSCVPCFSSVQGQIRPCTSTLTLGHYLFEVSRETLLFFGHFLHSCLHPRPHKMLHSCFSFGVSVVKKCMAMQFIGCAMMIYVDAMLCLCKCARIRADINTSIFPNSGRYQHMNLPEFGPSNSNSDSDSQKDTVKNQ